MDYVSHRSDNISVQIIIILSYFLRPVATFFFLGPNTLTSLTDLSVKCHFSDQ